MDIRELRIGNYVYETKWDIDKAVEYNEIVRVFKLCEDFEGQHINKLRSSNFHPIPLTEDILLKCGFEKGKVVQGSQYYYIQILSTECYLRPSYLGGYYLGILSNTELMNAKPIKYLHQLQNLYLALSGEELKIEL